MTSTIMTSTILGRTSDFYDVFSDVAGADLAAWQRAHDYGAEVVPVINEHWEKYEFPLDLVRKLADYDLLTDGLEVPGHETLSPLGAGLVTMETSRADGSMSTVIAVQAGLAMRSIANCGSEEQKQEWLPKLASAEKLGAFALTEPDHGSDSVALETTAQRTDDGWVINGQKRWIGNGAGGDISVVWARMDDGQVGGFLVPQDAPGYEAETIAGKLSLRSIPQALITLTDVCVPDSARLPNAQSFRDTAGVLTSTRVAVAWMALGHAIACYEAAREHVLDREQFGRPLAASQIIQLRLADMLGDITGMALYCRRLADLDAAGKLTPQQASLAKVQNTRKARKTAADARDMLGGSGILLENHVVRHMADLEALHTYEGTDTVQSLIVGKKITGIGAFK